VVLFSVKSKGPKQFIARKFSSSIRLCYRPSWSSQRYAQHSVSSCARVPLLSSCANPLMMLARTRLRSALPQVRFSKLPGLLSAGVTLLPGAVSFSVRTGGLALVQAALGRSHRVTLLQLLIAVSHMSPGWLPGLGWALRLFGGPLAALWTYGLTAKALFPAHWRSLQFWKRVFPIYCGYKKTQFMLAGKSDEIRSKAWTKRHQWGAKKVYNLCISLRGFYLKDGQVRALLMSIVISQSTVSLACAFSMLQGHFLFCFLELTWN
jgi:hypothetical protein